MPEPKPEMSKAGAPDHDLPHVNTWGESIGQFWQAHRAEVVGGAVVATGVAAVVLSRGKLASTVERLLPSAKSAVLGESLGTKVTELSNIGGATSTEVSALTKSAAIGKEAANNALELSAAPKLASPAVRSLDPDFEPLAVNQLSRSVFGLRSKEAAGVMSDIASGKKGMPDLEDTLNVLNREFKLPELRLVEHTNDRFHGLQYSGTGTISIGPGLQGKELVSVAIEEAAHQEQDVLRVWRKADIMRLGAVSAPKQWSELNAKLFGPSGSDDFIGRVLQFRNGQELSTPARQRANCLNWSMNGEYDAMAPAAELAANKLRQVSVALTSGLKKDLGGGMSIEYPPYSEISSAKALETLQNLSAHKNSVFHTDKGLKEISGMIPANGEQLSEANSFAISRRIDDFLADQPTWQDHYSNRYHEIDAKWATAKVLEEFGPDPFTETRIDALSKQLETFQGQSFKRLAIKYADFDRGYKLKRSQMRLLSMTPLTRD